MDAKISPSFWNDDTLATPSLRLAALWLRTHAHINPVGYGEFSLRRFVFETGLPSEALAECFQALGRGCRSDGRAYWLRTYISENFGRGYALASNNFSKGFRNHIAASNCPWLLDAIKEEYPELIPVLITKSKPSQGVAVVAQPQEKSREEKRGEEQRSGIEGAGSKGTRAARPADLAEAFAYAVEIGLPRTDVEAFFDHFEANGWRQGGKTPLRSWQAAMRTWQRRAGRFDKKSSEAAPASVLPFDPTKPHAHTGGAQEAT